MAKTSPHRSSAGQAVKYALILLLLQTPPFFTPCSGLLLKCPLHQMRLQKIVGFRPPLEFLKARNLIYAPTPASNFKDRNRYVRAGQLLPALPHFPPPNATLRRLSSDEENTATGPDAIFRRDRHIDEVELPSQRCWRVCTADADCIAYVHLLDTDECYGYTYIERTGRGYMVIGHELPLVADAEAIFYEKTCLKVPAECKRHLWTLTKIPGSSLVFQGKKTIATLVTRRECAEQCLFERNFECLSASFAPSYRNNRERFGAAPAIDGGKSASLHLTLGRCTLSDKDKMIQPDSFRAAPYDEEYIENQCHDRPIEHDHCSYELYANSSFVYAEAKFIGLTQKECQAYCTHEPRFYCQGVSFYYDGVLALSECRLHSEDIISLGPRSLKWREQSVYMRRVKCLDVQVVCTHDEMAIKYTPRDTFSGRMYANQHAKECMALGNGTQSTLLRLAIGSEVKEQRCGVLRAYEVTQDYQRIFISALVVIQNNGKVQTQGDRLIKVGCIVSNTTSSSAAATTTTAGGGYNANGTGWPAGDTDGDDVDLQPNAIALESSLEFTQQSLPNEGSLHFNVSDAGAGVYPTPRVTLQIIDLTRQHETTDVHIGQNLELQIVAEYTAVQRQQQQQLLPPLPDLYATALVARTVDNLNYVQLLDERGCPTDVSVFPGLERIRTPTQNVLRARFHAFKFAGTSMVNFDVRIHFCRRARCPLSNCVPLNAAVTATAASAAADQRRRRRRRRRRELLFEQRAEGTVAGGEQSSDTTTLLERFKVQNPVYISTVMDMTPPPLSAAPPPAMDYADHGVHARLLNLTLADVALPLNYNLNVHGPDATSGNSFIYGERGVLLIAGIEDRLHLDDVCLNQSLLLAIFIFWLIFQVALLFGCFYVMQKYKRLAGLEADRRRMQESLEYMEGRRVHWADQSGYTL